MEKNSTVPASESAQSAGKSCDRAVKSLMRAQRSWEKPEQGSDGRHMGIWGTLKRRPYGGTQGTVRTPRKGLARTGAHSSVFFVFFFFHLSVFDTQSSEALIAGKALGNPSLHLSLYRQ